MTQVKQGMIEFWKCFRIRNIWWLILRLVLLVFFKLWFRHLLVVRRLRLKEKLLEVLRVLIQCAFSSLSQGKSSLVSGPFLWPIWKSMITVLWFSLGEICSLPLWESSEIKMLSFFFFFFNFWKIWKFTWGKSWKLILLPMELTGLFGYQSLGIYTDDLKCLGIMVVRLYISNLIAFWKPSPFKL